LKLEILTSNNISTEM